MLQKNYISTIIKKSWTKGITVSIKTLSNTTVFNIDDTVYIYIYIYNVKYQPQTYIKMQTFKFNIIVYQ